MKVILIIIIIYVVLTIIGRYVIPYVLKHYLNRFNERFQQEMKSREKDDVPKKEGEVHIEYNPEKNKSKSTDIGEYTDFEEIK